MTDILDIRPMRPTDLDLTLSWARAEGWNPGLADKDPFYAADPEGFLMGWIGDQPVAAISIVKYGTDFAFLGLYIVAPEWRGRGYGKAVWDAGIASAKGRTIGLDGVVAQQGNYARSGLVLAHHSIRFGGRPTILTTRPAPVAPISSATLDAVLVFDATIFPAPRQAFLTEWLSPSSARTGLGWFEDGLCKGYGVIRPCVEGHKVGPLFAERSDIAEQLAAALIAETRSDFLWIDVPEPNGEGTALARRLGLTPGFETARMYLGKAPRIPLDSIYGITTLELG